MGPAAKRVDAVPWRECSLWPAGLWPGHACNLGMCGTCGGSTRRGAASPGMHRTDRAGCGPAPATADLRPAGLEIEQHGSPADGVVGDDGAQCGRSDTIRGRQGAQQRGDPASARRPSRAGRLTRTAAVDGDGIAAEALQELGRLRMIMVRTKGLRHGDSEFQIWKLSTTLHRKKRSCGVLCLRTTGA